MTPHTLFVWDFDWTVINCNSDEYIPGQFLDSDVLDTQFREHFQNTGDWHACVEAVVNTDVIQNQGVSRSRILEAARRMPYLQGVRQTLDFIHSHHADGLVEQMILSDGNTLFIGEFLENHKLAEYFGYGIISNRGQWDESGLLRVTHQVQESNEGGHQCQQCPANLCKTQALRNTLDKYFHERTSESGPRIIYMGDGVNDACPALNVLRQGDVLLARVGQKWKNANEQHGPQVDDAICSDDKEESSFGIMTAIERAGKARKFPLCQIFEWRTGDEMRKLVEELLGVQ